jgi:UDP-N-acetylglucosamine 2-epimerase (non-hydrolysing)
LEAGNRCFDENLPEEINRRIVDHTSDINLCYTEHARRNLIVEGLPKDRIFVVGSPMKEVFYANASLLDDDSIMSKVCVDKKKYILLSAHREENIDIEESFTTLMSAVNEIAEYYNMPVLYSVHPRSKSMIHKKGIKFHHNVILHEPFGFFDYMVLQRNAFCVVSDSGTLAEEASHFKFPAVSIRRSTERPEAIDKGNFVIGNIWGVSLIQAVGLASRMDANNDLGGEVVDYSDTNVSGKIIKIVQSYVSIINTIVWHK